MDTEWCIVCDNRISPDQASMDQSTTFSSAFCSQECHNLAHRQAESSLSSKISIPSLPLSSSSSFTSSSSSSSSSSSFTPEQISPFSKYCSEDEAEFESGLSKRLNNWYSGLYPSSSFSFLQLKTHESELDGDRDKTVSKPKRNRKVSQFSLQGYGSSSSPSSAISAMFTETSNYYSDQPIDEDEEGTNILLMVSQDEQLVSKDQSPPRNDTGGYYTEKFYYQEPLDHVDQSKEEKSVLLKRQANEKIHHHSHYHHQTKEQEGEDFNNNRNNNVTNKPKSTVDHNNHSKLNTHDNLNDDNKGSIKAEFGSENINGDNISSDSLIISRGRRSLVKRKAIQI